MRHDDLRMKRKVQKLGSSTLAVTVPADWARRHEIAKGDELILQPDENSGSLLVVPEGTAAGEREATIDADALDADAVGEAVVTQYVLGRRLITVEGDEPLAPAQYDAVVEAERALMGLGVVEETAHRIAVRCSVAPSDFELPTLLRRIGRTEASMRESAIDALVDVDSEVARRTIDRERQLKKLVSLFLRLLFATYRNPRLNQAVGVDTGFPLIGYRSVAQDKLLMGDSASNIAALVADGHVEAVPGAAAEHLRAIGDGVDEIARTVQDAVVEPDYATVIEARETKAAVDDLVEDAIAYLEAEQPVSALAIQRAIVYLQRSVRLTMDSLDVATHLSFRDTPDVATTE